MKRQGLALALVLALLLSGCGGSGRVECSQCGDQVDRWIALSDSDAVCARCFSDGGYLVCNNCGLAYGADDDGEADGYCSACAETETWYCAYCDVKKSLDDLVQVDDGYYLCGECLYWVVKPFDNAFAATYADYVSPLDLKDRFPGESRNDYLGIAGDWQEDDASSAFTEPDGYFLDHDDWYDEGYSEGYEAGKTDGYQAGLEKGKSTGKDAAYNEGYTRGYQDGRDGVGTGSTSSSSTSGNTSSSVDTDTQQSVTVYITDTGEKYHRYGCQYLRKSCIPVSLDDARDWGYTACSRCW